MMWEQSEKQSRYMPLPPPPPLVAGEVFLAGLGQAEDRLPPPPAGCFLLAVPAVVEEGASPGRGVLLGSGADALPHLDGGCLYAVVGGRLAEAFLAPALEDRAGEVPAAATAEIARLLRQGRDAARLGLAPDGCRGSGLAWQLIMELVRAKEEAPQKSSLTARAVALMEENFAHLYGVAELAQSLEVSKSHLIRVFSADMGMTPGQYLTQIRIERVKLILRAGGYSQEAAAAMTGFSGANYLCKVFRRQTGMTPGQYARQMGGRQDSGTRRQLDRLEEKVYL